jgi:ASC-1-like (ASCH) protein
MQSHTIHVDEPYYSYLISGDKTVEGRVYDKKRRKYRIGDRLVVNTRDLNSTEVYFIIINLHIFEDFEAMYQHFGKALLPNLPTKAMDVYSAYFSTTQIKTCGVVGIELRREL